MVKSSRFPLSLMLLFVLCACTGGAQAQNSLTTLEAPQGGLIVFGPVSGVTTQSAAMSTLLRRVHNNCGEKPQIGRPFQFKGTNAVGVFFAVTNHPQGNKQVAGLIVAVATGPDQVEAALLSDEASRFGKTVNPMLRQLLAAWHPVGQGGGIGQSSSRRSAQADAGRTGPPAQLQPLVLPDRSASVGVPAGWRVDPTSANGTIQMAGPRGEFAFLNEARAAVDPTNPILRQLQQGGGLGGSYGRIVCPYNVNLVQAYPEILRQWRHLGGNDRPVNFQNVHAEPLPGQQGQRCVHVTGIRDAGGGDGEQEMNLVLCTTFPNQGSYMVLIFQTLLPIALADQERATAGAVLASFELNRAVVNQQASAYAAPGIAAIHAIGERAAAQRDARNSEYDAQHAGYWAQQDTNARNSLAFSNLQLDQTVVQDNDPYGDGTVGHATLWNSTADALVKADPDRFSYVTTPNYIKGTDF